MFHHNSSHNLHNEETSPDNANSNTNLKLIRTNYPYSQINCSSNLNLMVPGSFNPALNPVFANNYHRGSPFRPTEHWMTPDNSFLNQLNQQFLIDFKHHYQRLLSDNQASAKNAYERNASLGLSHYNQSYNEPSPLSEHNPSPIKSVYVFKDRKFDNFNDYSNFVRAYDETKHNLRNTPKYEDINYLNFPIESTMNQLELLYNFNFATPQKVHFLDETQRVNLTSDEYDEMRKDLDLNGFDADSMTENSELSGSAGSETMSLIDHLQLQSVLPPLLKTDPSPVWRKIDEVNQMEPANFSQSLPSSPNVSKGSSAKKRTPKPNKKSLEDVSW